ncbi:MAG: hypothetical protein ACYCZB_03065 [Acidiphilium sp.]
MNSESARRILRSLRKSAVALREAERFSDHWTEGRTNAAPRREEVEFGRPQSASGGGAVRMIRDYSNVARQHGQTATAEQISRDLFEVSEMMRAMQRSQAEIETAIVELVAAKARDDDDDEADEDEEDDEDRDLRAKAKARRAKLRKALKSGTPEAAAKAVDSMLDQIAVVNSDVRSVMEGLMTLARAGGRPIGSVALQKAHMGPDTEGILIKNRYTGKVENTANLKPKLTRAIIKSGSVFEAVAKSVAMLPDSIDRENGATVLRMLESGIVGDHHIAAVAENASVATREALKPLFN